MKRDDEKGKEKQVNSKALQAIPPNVLATRYLREANTLGDYAEAAEVYKQAIDYFEIEHGGVYIIRVITQILSAIGLLRYTIIESTKRH
jgi:hypothetical protein